MLLQGTVYESTNPPTLEMECEVDEMDAEQTWPTEQDFAEAEDAKKLAKRVPKGNAKCLVLMSCIHVCLEAMSLLAKRQLDRSLKSCLGTSAYQAVWMLSDDEEEEEEEGEDMEDREGEEESEESEEEYVDLEEEESDCYKVWFICWV